MSQKYIERSVNVAEYLKKNLITTKTMETTLRDPVFSLIIHQYFPVLALLKPNQQFMILYNQRTNLQIPKDLTVTERVLLGGKADIRELAATAASSQKTPITASSSSSQKMPIPAASSSTHPFPESDFGNFEAPKLESKKRSASQATRPSPDKKRKTHTTYCIGNYCHATYAFPPDNENCFSSKMDCLWKINRKPIEFIVPEYLSYRDKDSLSRVAFDPEKKESLLREIKNDNYLDFKKFPTITIVNALKHIILELRKENDYSFSYEDIRRKFGYIVRFNTSFYFDTDEGDDAIYFLRLASVLERKMNQTGFVWLLEDMFNYLKYNGSHRTIRINGADRSRYRTLLNNIIRYMMTQEITTLQRSNMFNTFYFDFFEDSLTLMILQVLYDMKARNPKAAIFIMNSLWKNFDFDFQRRDRGHIEKGNLIRAQIKAEISKLYLSESIALQITQKKNLPPKVREILEEEQYRKRFNELYAEEL